MASISIMYNAEDSDKWSLYLHKLLSKHGGDINVKLCDLKQNRSKIQSTVDSVTLAAVLVSPCMLEPDIEHALKELQGHQNVVLLDCFLEEDEKEEILDKFTFFQSLKLLKLTVDKGKNYALVAELVEIVETREKVSREKRLLIKKSCSKFCMIPNTIYQQPAVVYLNFEKEIPGTVNVSCGKCAEGRTRTEKYNPYSVMFTAENLQQGKNKVGVFVDDIQVGHCELHVHPYIQTAYECPAYMCQVLGIGSNDTEALDKKLVNIFRDSAPDDQSHLHLLGDEPRAVSQSNTEVPTLLHFAAKNGLSYLGSHLLNVPGSGNVCLITNSRGKNVYELAMESGFEDFANYTKLFLETEAMVLACDRIYMNTRSYQKDEIDKPDDELQKQTDTSEENPPQSKSFCYSLARQLSGIYSVPEEVLDEEQVPVQEQSEIDDRPPQPFPRTRTLDNQRRHDIRHQKSLNDLYPVQQTSGVKKQHSVDLPLSPAVFRGRTSSLHALVCEPEQRSGSRAMDELIEINKQTMEGHFTMKNAEMLFEAWKKRNAQPSSSMRQKQQNLEKLKEKYESFIKKTPEEEKSAIRGILAKFTNRFSGKKKKGITIDITKPMNVKDPVDGDNPTRWSSISSSSSGSSCSRESQVSSTSVDSSMGASITGSDSDEPTDETTDVRLRKKSSEHEKPSKKEQFLRSVSIAIELDLPPPIPPRGPKLPPLPDRKY
ncbi:phosphoinositide 3-kinase adapter protein 1-like isoform X2 [Pecten maximus]|uniref:phosphoinositide 3-kinase adapter protein 1-like isoform X2 n=1 Tax=Pecten maximus TaxID=6579 RepID=UPI001458D30F|nr:phosphoinositide 3-kinase adapter protein 1-like isoform X2 [Pecten maximus]